MKKFIVRETRLALEFQKNVVKFLLKVIGVGMRYAFWMLPWVLVSLFAARPLLTALKGVEPASMPPPAEVSTVQPNRPPVPEPAQDHQWDALQRRFDSGVRTLERLVRRIPKK